MFDPAFFFREVVDDLRQVFFVYDLEARRVQYVNAAYEAELGGRPDRVDDDVRLFLAQLHPDDQEYAAECLERLQQGRLREDVELRLRQPNDQLRWLQLRLSMHWVEGRSFLCGFVQDITAHKEYQRNAEKFNNKKNATLEILSHDLAGPLSLMKTLAGQLRYKVAPNDDPTVNELLRVIEHTCHESVNLIHDFVDHEFLESASIQLQLKRLNLVERMHIMVDSYRHTSGLHFGLRTNQPAIYLAIDENKFMQVLNNMVGNALKFTPDGGHITLTVEEHPEHVHITIADDGIGIPAALQPALFEKFSRARRPGLHGEKATGLGMSISRTIVRLHQGDMWVESAEGRGTTVHIELPKLAAG